MKNLLNAYNTSLVLKNSHCLFRNNKIQNKPFCIFEANYYPKFEDNKTYLVKIDYSVLNNQTSDLSEEIVKAFGKQGLGLIAIKNIPNLKQARQNILKKGFEFYHLDDRILKKLEKPEINYMVGFNRGRSYTENEFEYLTNAFYARTQNDRPSFKYDKALEEKYKNVWPDEKDIKDFKKFYFEMGNIMHNILVLLLKHVDEYMKKIIKKDKVNNNNYEIKNNFLDFAKKNDSVCRLITYFPIDSLDKDILKIKDAEKLKKNWCGWHRDFGLLTALCHPIYFNKKGEIIPNIKSGLKVQDRQNKFHDLKYEEDEVLVQSGDAAFFISGGNIISTPHSVKITEGIRNDIYRATFVNFFDPPYDYELFLPEGISIDEMFDKDPFQMKGMFPKFKQGCLYKDFIMSAAEKYYPLSNESNII